MTQDKLLHDLAREAIAERREEKSRLPEIWDRLSAGELTPQEEAELIAQATESPEAQRAYEAFRPLSNSFRDRVIAAIGDQARSEETGGFAPSVAPSAGPRTTKPTEAKILPFRRRWAAILVPAAAAAAAILLMIAGPGDESLPLPGYRLELASGIAALRSGDPIATTDETVFVNGSRFELVLRPATKATGDVAVRCFLAGTDEIEIWEVPAEVFATGAIQIVGEIGADLAIEPGNWTLYAVVGRPGRLPDASQLHSHLANSAGDATDWQLLQTDLRIEHNAR